MLRPLLKFYLLFHLNFIYDFQTFWSHYFKYEIKYSKASLYAIIVSWKNVA